MTLSLVACGGNSKKETINLTLDNLSEYLTLEANVTESELDKTSQGITGGSAEVKITATKQSDISFEAVSIKIEASTGISYFNGLEYGWEFVSDNKQDTEFEHGISPNNNYKTITLSVPFEGDMETVENLTFVPYRNYYILTPKELSSVHIKVIDVSGSVIIN